MHTMPLEVIQGSTGRTFVLHDAGYLGAYLYMRANNVPLTYANTANWNLVDAGHWYTVAQLKMDAQLQAVLTEGALAQLKQAIREFSRGGLRVDEMVAIAWCRVHNPLDHLPAVREQFDMVMCVIRNKTQQTLALAE